MAAVGHSVTASVRPALLCAHQVSTAPHLNSRPPLGRTRTEGPRSDVPPMGFSQLGRGLEIATLGRVRRPEQPPF